jgi:replicative superfamily II helicase
MRIDTKFTGLKDPSWHLNPVQELVYPLMNSRNNLLVSAKTSAGKTTIAVMCGSGVVAKGGTMIYLGSFKALAEEKCDEWNESSHPWSKVPKTSITGDYDYDSAKLREIEDARIISTTPESLLSAVRNKASDKAKYLSNVKLIVCDETHLVAEDGRGATYEVALTELLTDFPHIRVVMLSGTLPNHGHFINWIEGLTGRTVDFITSDYRPIEVNHHYKAYHGNNAHETENYRIGLIDEIIDMPDKAHQKFLIVVHKKAFGNKILAHLKDRGKAAMFHSADIKDLADRKRVEALFKKGGLQYLICTSTLTTGVNLPARNVIYTTAEAGGGDIPAFTIQQGLGRAGRPQYDTEGDAYILLSSPHFEYHKKRIIEGEPIVSRLEDKTVIAEHMVGAIYMKRFDTLEGFLSWYHSTLAYQQFKDKMSVAEIDRLLKGTLEDMTKRSIVKSVDGKLKLTKLGTITAQMLLDPYVVFELACAMDKYFNLDNPTDVDLAIALGSNRLCAAKFITKEQSFIIPKLIKNAIREGSEMQAPCVAALYFSVKGEQVPHALSNVFWQFRTDADRYSAAMVRACKECYKWTTGKSNFRGAEKDASDRIRLMFTRAKHGCRTWDQARGLQEGLTKRESAKLSKVGIESRSDIDRDLETALSIISGKRQKELGIVKP